MRSTVDFPLPLGLISLVICPGAANRLTNDRRAHSLELGENHTVVLDNNGKVLLSPKVINDEPEY
ncbi:hypothetical protein [Streptomyces sp. NPDC004250]|uniref:hypothetical protein n=1 Tax=Streptomyces sp. NPDC004250 TaxID=3364692 RepID=UPI0036BCC4FF